MLSTAYLNLQMCEPELALAAVTKIDQVIELAMGLGVMKPVFGVFDKVRFKTACSAIVTTVNVLKFRTL